MVRWVTSYVHVRNGSGAGVGAVILIYGSAEPEQKEIITAPQQKKTTYNNKSNNKKKRNIRCT